MPAFQVLEPGTSLVWWCSDANVAVLGLVSSAIVARGEVSLGVMTAQLTLLVATATRALPDLRGALFPPQNTGAG